jgi:hypothetical protein
MPLPALAKILLANGMNGERYASLTFDLDYPDARDAFLITLEAP